MIIINIIAAAAAAESAAPAAAAETVAPADRLSQSMLSRGIQKATAKQSVMRVRCDAGGARHVGAVCQ